MTSTPYTRLPEDLTERLKQLEHSPKREMLEDNGIDPLSYKPAAVLLPLLFEDGAWHLLFTRRSEGLSSHQGQVSFPGGGWEVGDEDIIATALRETHEEIGISQEDVQILGTMSSLALISHYLVTPVVGIIPWPYPLKLFAGEVARVFSVPVSWLADPENYYTSTKMFEGKAYEIVYYQLFDGEKLWGATAEITQSFVKLLA